jgi:hypothetical protein
MTLLDRILEAIQWRLLRSEAGICLWRFLRWGFATIAPYTPPRSEIPLDRAAAFVLVEVRRSTIRAAGQGLFSLQHIEAGVRVEEYTGDTVDSLSKYVRLRIKDYVADSPCPGIFIGASRRPEALMRYINHHPDASRRNVRFRNEGTRKYYETTRPVQPDEELLTDYGELYWRLRLPSRRKPRTLVLS